MERRVQLLHDGTLEKDMLDEQARRALNLSQADEIVIMRIHCLLINLNFSYSLSFPTISSVYAHACHAFFRMAEGG